MHLDFLKYFFYTSTNEHGIHSPFVFEFYLNIIRKKTNNKDFFEIENLRKELKNNDTTIEIEDFGAGVKGKKLTHRKINEIAKKSLKSKKYGQLLFRIVQFLQPKTIIDLGTSLGITTSYFALAAKNSTILTFEGCTNTSNIAKDNFEKLHLENIEVITGNIDSTLPSKLEKIQTIDFAFFDANHQFKPTMFYFETCLEKINNQSVFVFDDIYWSKEMKKAWQEIKKNPKVSVTIDLFFIGLVLFRKEQVKEDFILRF